MSFTDATYYVLDISIPASDYSNLTASIARYEKEIIMKLFGYELGTLVLAYDADTSPQRIIDIVEGAEFDIGDYTIKWNGLVNTDKISLLAYYVYYQWTKSRATHLGTVGTMKLKSENADPVGLTYKLTNAWHRLFELYGKSGQSEYLPTCFNFLMQNIDDYPEWIFTEIEDLNTFGI